MSEYFLGQIMMVGFNYAPKNFAQCNGQRRRLLRNGPDRRHADPDVGAVDFRCRRFPAA